MAARNNDQLRSQIMPGLKLAVDYVVQKIWKDNRELIKTIIYEAYQPSRYKRTGEFQEAWVTDVKSFRATVEGELKFDPRLLSVDSGAIFGDNDSPKGTHSSLVDGTPMTQYLAEIIYEGLSGAIYQKGYAKDVPSYHGAWTRKRDVWTQLNKKIGKSTLRRYFEEGLKRSGIKYKRRVAGIKRVEYYG